MDHIITNSLIMAALIVVVIIPVYILSRNHSRMRLQKLTRRFDELAADHKITIVEKENFASVMIGYDQNSRTLLFLKSVTDKEESKIMKLDEVNGCKVVENAVSGSVTEIKIICETVKGTIELTFYKQFDDNEMKIKSLRNKAEFWKQKISYLLQHK